MPASSLDPRSRRSKASRRPWRLVVNPSLDALVFSDLVSRCLEALRNATRLSEGPVERHSARAFFIMEKLAEQASLEMDREVAACAAVLHDIGLYDAAARPRFYLRHGRVSADGIIGCFPWNDDRKKRCLEAIALHHRLTPQWDSGVEVELLRLADLVDASRGIVSLGLDRGWLRSLFTAIERKGLQRELLRHSLRGAPCMTRGIAGALINAPRRQIPRKAPLSESSK